VGPGRPKSTSTQRKKSFVEEKNQNNKKRKAENSDYMSLRSRLKNKKFNAN